MNDNTIIMPVRAFRSMLTKLGKTSVANWEIQGGHQDRYDVGICYDPGALPAMESCRDTVIMMEQ